MKKDIVIFGAGKIAEVVYYYAKEECGLNVHAFCVDQQFKNSDSFQGLPLVAFENVNEIYPSSDYGMFVAVGYQDLNALRETRCNDALAKGYELVSVISPLANLPKNVITGWNCFIMPPAIIHPFVEIGNNVFVWSGAMLGHHTKIGHHNWITSSANIGGTTEIGSNCFLAMNATIGNSVKIGDRCFLGANTLVVKDLEHEQVVISESSKPIRLNSKQFLRFSSFSNL
jgi:sugar O-acyltransferase (sialic acid O-acetyltransferase NeuD family)